MSSSSLNIRRATVDDLPALKTMWLAAGLPAAELKERLTEFHVRWSFDILPGAARLRL